MDYRKQTKGRQGDLRLEQGRNITQPLLFLWENITIYLIYRARLFVKASFNYSILIAAPVLLFSPSCTAYSPSSVSERWKPEMDSYVTGVTTSPYGKEPATDCNTRHKVEIKKCLEFVQFLQREQYKINFNFLIN